ncbi:FG-GAP repeat domain-containing protein, partial [Marinicella sediminis]
MSCAGSGNFIDVTDAAGIRQGYWGWGACLADFNNDGHLDIYHE